MAERLQQLADQGVSIWLDDLSRGRISGGGLQTKIYRDSVSGVTTTPTLFAAAIGQGEAYRAQRRALAGVDVVTAVRALTTTDVRDACDIFRETYLASHGYDGRVSIEVDPRLAYDSEATVSQAKDLRETVGRENVLIKIPATGAGLSAIRRSIAASVSINVTVIFAIERYRQVMDAYLSGLEDAAAAGRDISRIHSVASFFVSRVDTEVDKRLAAIGSPAALALQGKAAVANARIAYAEFERVVADSRFQALAAKGANLQRPLWASTGVKNPAYRDTLYVEDLIAPHTVNTMPEKTLRAVADHAKVADNTISPQMDAAHVTMAELAAVGVDMDDVTAQLEAEAVTKFVDSWAELTKSVSSAIGA